MNSQSLHKLFLDSKGICTDTRKIEPDTIFFALKGDNFNGNEFALKALQEGCKFAVVDEDTAEKDDRLIQVDSVLQTLQNLANYHRKQFNIPVIGITGSNGKTTTKELIAAVLGRKYNVLFTQGNLNNHLGVPFTLLKITNDHDIAIIEMGANKPGDIQELAEIAEPNYGIITNIGAAHIEGLGSLQGVIETKTALYRWIKNIGGTLFYNADDEILVSHLPDVKTMSYGERKGDVRGELVKLDPFVNLKWQDYNGVYQSPEISTHLVGKYNFFNFLAAIAIGLKFEVHPEQINMALESYIPSNNRSQVQKSERNTLIVDCYNANATSMKAALESFNEVEHAHKLAILGDMLELGDISVDEHQNMVNYLKKNNINTILVGDQFAATNHTYKWYQNYQELLKNEDLGELEDHLILLKGSRGIKLENLIEHL